MFNIQFTNGAQLGANVFLSSRVGSCHSNEVSFAGITMWVLARKSILLDVDPLLLVTSCATARVIDLTCVRLSAVSGSSRHQFWLHQISLGFSRVRSRNVLQYVLSSRLIWLRSRVRLCVLFALISTSKVHSRLAFVWRPTLGANSVVGSSRQIRSARSVRALGVNYKQE